ncbi:recombination-associated protein RdgC [Fundidesulfovibrio butyratiphilus]
MGILSASGSFTRYAIVEDVTGQLAQELPERLAKYAFRDIDDTSDERSYGFVCLEDWLDSHWRAAPPEKAHYMAFSMRLDTRRVSPAVMKKHLLLALAAEKQALKEQGKNFISKDRKQEIKDQTRLKLMARALPVPAVFDVVWNLRDNRVYLATTNSKVRALFEDLFTLAFDLHLEPLTPYFLALRLADPAKRQALDDLEPSPFAAG